MARGDEVRREPTPSVKFTYEDFVHFPDDGKRHELIDGEHYVTPSPNTKHQSVASNLHAIVWAHLSKHRIGEVFLTPFDVVFSNFDIVEPDLIFISQDRRNVVTEKHICGAPDLVVEILSVGTRKTDEITKRKLYERFGVREYWIVDPELDAIKVYRRENDRLAKAAELTAERGDRLTTPLLPDWSAPLKAIFRPPFESRK